MEQGVKSSSMWQVVPPDARRAASAPAHLPFAAVSPYGAIRVQGSGFRTELRAHGLGFRG